MTTAELINQRRKDILSTPLTFKEKYEALFQAKHRKYNQLRLGTYEKKD